MSDTQPGAPQPPSPQPSGARAGAPAVPASAASPATTLLVTGMSGAGRSTAMKFLEDIGYEAVDNLPLALIDGVLAGRSGSARPLAIGIDVRTRDFAADRLLARLDQAQAEPLAPLRLLFVDCEDDALRRRFTETRRPHPLAAGQPVLDGIAQERRLVSPLRARADLVLDTTHLSPGDLKRLLIGHFRPDSGPLAIFVQSFSYRGGLPREADLVFDVRFLRNPHYDPGLRPLTGLDGAVAGFIGADPAFAAFRDGVTGLLAALLPRYEQEGKSYLTIAFGCTGGRHRSVYMAETVGRWLRELGRRVELSHRELRTLGAAAPGMTPAAAPAAPAFGAVAAGGASPGSETGAAPLGVERTA